MKRIFLAILLVIFTLSCKKDKVDNAKHTVVCTFKSTNMTAEKTYTFKDKSTSIGILGGNQSFDIEVSVGESITLEMSTPDRIMASAFEVYIFYKEKEIAFSNTLVKIGEKNTIRLEKKFEKSDFQ